MKTLTPVLSVPEAAYTRRSIRRFKDIPIPKDELKEILRVAGMSPSAWNIQPWRVAAVTNPEVKAQLQEAAFGQKQIGEAPTVLVVWSDMQDALDHIDDFLHPNLGPERHETEKAGILKTFNAMTPDARENWGRNQTNIFLGYLLLALQAHGYSSSPMLGFSPDKVKQILGLPDHVTIPALVATGVADEEGFTHHRHPIDRFTKFVA